MKLADNIYIDFEHDSQQKFSSVFLYEHPLQDAIAEAHVSVYYKDTFSRKGGRLACMRKLLDPEKGPFKGFENRQFRREVWQGYWQAMPQDLF